MSSQINIPAVFIANAMGIAIIFTVLISFNWNIGRRTYERLALLVMMVTSVISCIVDPVCFYADGRPGLLNHMLVFWGNTWLYFSIMLSAVGWLLFVCFHVNIRLHKLHILVLKCLFWVGCILLAVNIFRPVVFTVGSDNVYFRTGFYWFYLAMQTSSLLTGLIVYLYAKRKSGRLIFFPVWAFVIPVLLGAVIQSVFYGVSTIVPFIAVSIGCITACLQKELIYCDKLTGLYNRFYLNIVEDFMKKKRDKVFTAIMLDINRFKFINDSCGHLTGDFALIETANILKDAVGVSGQVIRYAGDEFIIILNTVNDEFTEKIIDDINRRMEAFNSKGAYPYELSVSVGYSRFNIREQSLDSLLGVIDKRMYENKQEFYRSNNKYDRRIRSKEND